MHSVRPSGTPMTDSSSAPASLVIHLCDFLRMPSTLATDCREPTALWPLHSWVAVLRCQRSRHHQEATLTRSDPFVPRIAPHACPRNETSQLNSMSWNREPSPHPVSFWKPKGSVRGTKRDVFPLREASDPVGARSLLSTTLSREHEAAPHSPRTTPARTIGWLTGIVFFASGSGPFGPSPAVHPFC